MLVADKLNVESSLRVRMLQIREREFDLFLDRIRTIGTLATVLALATIKRDKGDVVDAEKDAHSVQWMMVPAGADGESLPR